MGHLGGGVLIGDGRLILTSNTVTYRSGRDRCMDRDRHRRPPGGSGKSCVSAVSLVSPESSIDRHHYPRYPAISRLFYRLINSLKGVAVDDFNHAKKVF